jgi:hypothetical protein
VDIEPSPGVGSGVKAVTKAFNCSGRSGVSRFLLFGCGMVEFDEPSLPNQVGVWSAYLRQLDGGTPTTVPETTASFNLGENNPPESNLFTYISIAKVEDVPANANQTFDLYSAFSGRTSAMLAKNFTVAAVDMGTV